MDDAGGRCWRRAGIDPADIPGAAHAAEHAAIGMLPLVATSDRWDIGGVSTALHPDTGLPTILVYDGHPGGAGFAERGFAAARTWLGATRDAIAACECPAGCPVVRAVAQVRQRQRAPGQARRPCAARCRAGPGTALTVCRGPGPGTSLPSLRGTALPSRRSPDIRFPARGTASAGTSRRPAP